MMTRAWLPALVLPVAMLLAAMLLPAHGGGPGAGSDEDVRVVLEHQTQQLLDAITSGSSAVWDRLLDPRASFTTEDGEVRSKAAMMGDIRPLPKTITGKITVTDFKATVHGEVAIATHVDDEHETFHGHALHCQYRTTDTWLRTQKGWRLIGSQVLALRTDPPAIELAPAQLDELVGRYGLAADLSYEIRRSGPVLIGQETGRKPDTLRAETRDVLFVPGRPRYRKVFRRDGQGRVADFAERREAWDLVWTRERSPER
jgi:ketosteroid isomerase-like protein